MNTLPHRNCDCWRLTWPLAGEKLPDHICPKTATTTIYCGPPIPGAELTPDGAWPVYYRPDGNWGTPPRQLGLVIREWAQEEPNRTLANQLRGSWDWSRAASSIYGDFVRWRRRHPDAPLSDWIEGPDDDRRYAALLWQHRLPGTAATLRFLRACSAYRAYHRPTRQGDRRLVQVTDDGGVEEVVLPEPADEEARYQAAFDAVLAGHPEALPSRGALVTTLVFARTGPVAEFGVRYDPDPWFHIEGAAEFSTGDVLEMASAVARKHRNWLRKLFGHHPLAETSAIHRAKPGAFQSADFDQDPFDYVQEATSRTANLLMAHPNWNALAEWSKSEKIKNLLDDARDTVRQRRTRAGLRPAAPRGWRKVAEAEIFIRIAAIDPNK